MWSQGIVLHDQMAVNVQGGDRMWPMEGARGAVGSGGSIGIAAVVQLH